MPREFVGFPAELDLVIRSHVADHCSFSDATSTDAVRLLGTPVSFYVKTWLAYLQTRAGDRAYFLVQLRRRGKKIKCVIPIASVEGSLDRANRELKLNLNPQNVIDYMNFYYAFTPKEEPVPSRLWGLAQFAVPRTLEDLDFRESHEAGGQQPGTAQDRCSADCLGLGAIWHFLDSREHRHFLALRCKERKGPYSRLSGKMCVQLERALFSADFRLAAASGLPALSNPELLYESDALSRPEILPERTLPLPRYLLRKEWWLAIKGGLSARASQFVRRVKLGLSWTLTVIFALFLALSATFPIFEILRLDWLRQLLGWVGFRLGLEGWPMTLFGLSTISIATFLWVIYYTANIDKIFNWLFRITPRGLEQRLARRLNPLIDRYDRELIAQDTLRKRAWMAIRLLAWWTTYVVLAFASVQMALVGMGFEQAASPEMIVLALWKQAALNVPLIVYVMVRHPWLFGTLDPSGAGLLNGTLVFFFHLAVAAIILKGIYRIWVFTKEASPRAFYRKLRLHA